MKKNELKKNAIKSIKEVLSSPFAVINAINSNRANPAIAKYLTDLGITGKMSLNNLLGLYDYADRNIFCKLKKMTCKQNFSYCEYKQYKIGNSYYELIPIKFTIEDFFASIESKKKIDAYHEKMEQLYTKELNRKNKMTVKNIGKITRLAYSIQESNPDLIFEKCFEIAKLIA